MNTIEDKSDYNSGTWRTFYSGMHNSGDHCPLETRTNARNFGRIRIYAVTEAGKVVYLIKNKIKYSHAAHISSPRLLPFLLLPQAFSACPPFLYIPMISRGWSHESSSSGELDKQKHVGQAQGRRTPRPALPTWLRHLRQQTHTRKFPSLLSLSLSLTHPNHHLALPHSSLSLYLGPAARCRYSEGEEGGRCTGQGSWRRWFHQGWLLQGRQEKAEEWCPGGCF